MSNMNTPAGMARVISAVDSVCRKPYIYHLEDVPLPCFFIETAESHRFITEYIAERFISESVFFPKSTCHSVLYTLEDSSDLSLARLIYTIDSNALLNQPEGICIGIIISQAVISNAKDNNLARFFRILAGYRKVCWVFFTSDMDCCDMQGFSRLIYDNFPDEIYPVCTDEYTTEQLAGAVMARLESARIILQGREGIHTELMKMLADCHTMNQALGYLPTLIKKASYRRHGLVLTASALRTLTGGEINE